MTLTDGYFNCTERERAVFEAGIKLASLYHQYMGAPVNLENMDSFEAAMKEGMRAQPYVKESWVGIDREIVRSKLSRFGYCSLSEEMLSARVVVRYRDVKVTAYMGWVEELKYPLMRVEKVEEDKQ
ncbi:MAG: dihydroneopterin aldolase family protein [Thermoplasmatota archaeon]